MHVPSTLATGTIPMPHPSLLLLQHQKEPLAAGAEGGAGLGLHPQNQRKVCASRGLFSAGTCSLQLS